MTGRGSPSRGLVQWIEPRPLPRSPSRELVDAMAAALAAMGEVMAASMAEVGAALARAGQGGGVRAERGDPTGDGPMREPPP